ncbi:MAG: tyrosine-type recombinase/integrase [Patescibacteria group bacterium]
MLSPEKNKNISLPYLDDFLLNMQNNNLSSETIYNYERDLQVFQDFLSAIDTNFTTANKRSILFYKAYLNSKDRKTPLHETSKIKLSSFSTNRMLSALRSYLKFLVDMDHETPLTPEMVKLTKNEKNQYKISELLEIIKIIEAPMDFEKTPKVALRNRAMFEMLFSTGMRISELINLKQNQIDKTGRILIRGKGKKERFVYLTARAEKHLKNYLETRGIVETPYLFIPYHGKNVHKNDKKISPNYMQERIKKYREWLSINIPISCHSIRHAFATYMAENGASPAAIQVLLGHESLNTTTRYINASNKFAEETHRKFHPLKD